MSFYPLVNKVFLAVCSWPFSIMHTFHALLSITHSNDSLLPGNKTHVIDFDQSRAQILNSERRSYINVYYSTVTITRVNEKNIDS